MTDLKLSIPHLDFGQVNYAAQVESDRKTIQIFNSSEQNTYELDTNIINFESIDFPVIIKYQDLVEIQDGVYKEGNLTLYPGGKATISLSLVSIEELFYSTKPRTSFFTISSKCYIKYTQMEERKQNLVEEENETPQENNDIIEDTFLKLTFSASLCTSVLYMKDSELIFPDCLSGNEYYQELMIWNRSESNLSFIIEKKAAIVKFNAPEKPSEDSISVNIKFYAVNSEDNISEISAGTLINVPMFATKLLKVKVSSQTPGQFSESYNIRNKYNPTNIYPVEISGNILSSIESNEIFFTVNHAKEFLTTSTPRKINLGEMLCGKLKTEKMVLINNSDQELQVVITLNGKSLQEIEVFVENEKLELSNIDQKQSESYDNDIGCPLEANDFQLSSNSVDPTVVQNKITPILDLESLFFETKETFNSSSPSDVSEQFPQANPPPSAPYYYMETEKTINIGKFCGLMFGEDCYRAEYSGLRESEIIDTLGFTNYQSILEGRPFQKDPIARYKSLSAKSLNYLQNCKYITPKQQSKPVKRLVTLSPSIGTKKIFQFPNNQDSLIDETLYAKVTLSPRSQRFLTIRVTPKKDFQQLVMTSENINKLLNRSIGLNIKTEKESNSLEYLLLIQYKACQAGFKLTPKSVDAGTCNIGENYEMKLSLSNISDLPITLNPVLNKSEQNNNVQLSLSKICLEAKETKIVSFPYQTLVENVDFKVNISMVCMDDENVIENIELYGKSLDMNQIRIHNLYYKIYDKFILNPNSSTSSTAPTSTSSATSSSSFAQTQLNFPRSLFDLPNVLMFRIKNVSKDKLLVKVSTQNKGKVRLLAFPCDNNEIKHFKLIAPEKLNARFTEIDNLKWGEDTSKDSRINNGENDDNRRNLKLKNNEKSADISFNLEALDIIRSRANTGTMHDINPSHLHMHSLHVPLSRQISHEVNNQQPSHFNSTSFIIPHHSHNITKIEEKTYTLEQIVEFFDLINKFVLPWIFEENNMDIPPLLRKVFIEGNRFIMIENEDSKKELDFSNFLNDSNVSSNIVTTIKEIYQTMKHLLNNYLVDKPNVGLSVDDSLEDLFDFDEKEFLIPIGSSYAIAVIWEPHLKTEIIADYVEYSNDNFVTITLPDVYYTAPNTKEEEPLSNSEKVDSIMNSPSVLMTKSTSNTSVSDESDPDSYQDRISLSRTLPLRSSGVLSEMTIIQKTINYGRVMVGDTCSQTITIVNKSPVLCLYSFSKSGSILSGFLNVINGRKGIIPSFSSKKIEIVFKPKLAESLEELLSVENILNPQNAQSILVKAKVLRAESFVLNYLEDKSDTSNHFPLSMPNGIAENDIKQSFQNLFGVLDKPNTPNALSSTLPPLPSSKAFDRNSKLTCFYIGTSVLGKSPTFVLKLKLKNTTNKRRQFIIDGSSDNAIELIGKQELNRYPSADTSTLSKLITPTHHTFVPLPEFLRSILIARCHFVSEIIQNNNGNGNGNSAYDEEIAALYDKLEKYQQKLKIAIRKEKSDKVAKLQKKMNDVLATLTSLGADTSSVSTSTSAAASTPSSNSNKPESKIIEEVAQNNESGNNQTKPSNIIIKEDSELAHHIWLESEQECLITLRITYLPGSRYRPWPNILPFLGRVLVFEGKNEDYVKTVCFGMLLSASSNLLNPDKPLTIEKSGIAELAIQKSEFVTPKFPTTSYSSGTPYIITIATWCSVSLRQAFPKFKKTPPNTLGACIKLIRTNRSRTLSGAFTIFSFFAADERKGQVEITLEEHFIGISNTNSVVNFDSKVYGQLYLLSSSENTNYLQHNDMMSDIEGPHSNSFNVNSNITANSNILNDPTLGQHGHNLAEGKFVFPLESNNLKKQFQLLWIPSVLDKSLSEDIRIMGALSVKYIRTQNTPEVNNTSSGNNTSSETGNVLKVPFICTYQHKSVIKIDKYYTFENIFVGSYSTCQVSISNESSTEDLHYTLASEQISDKYNSRGSLEIISGKTGVIPPGRSKSITLLFTATSYGKFEQKLWIQNINDSFDCKYIIIQANVNVAQEKFIVLPDIEFSDDSHSKRYKPLDFGLLQIFQNKTFSYKIEDKYLSSGKKVFPLRVQNVSTKQLYVTALPNLRNQCYIYADAQCTLSAVNILVEKSVTFTFYVVMKPSDTSTLTLDANATNISINSAESNIRQLIGGIRLVVFVEETLNPIENTPSTPNAVLDPTSNTTPIVQELAITPLLTQRKLLEIPLSFTATVGKSILSSHIQYSLDELSSWNSNILTFEKKNLLYTYTKPLAVKNESSIFPLEYLILLDNDEDPLTFTNSPSFPLTNNLASPGSTITSFDYNSGIRLNITEDKYGKLNPMGTILLTLSITVDPNVTGLFNKVIKILNLSTNEILELNFSIFVDPKKIILTSESNKIANALKIQKELESSSQIEETSELTESISSKLNLKRIPSEKFMNSQSTSIRIQPFLFAQIEKDVADENLIPVSGPIINSQNNSENDLKSKTSFSTSSTNNMAIHLHSKENSQIAKKKHASPSLRTCSNSNYLASLFIKNESGVSVNLLPVSDIPIRIDFDSNPSFSIDSSNIILLSNIPSFSSEITQVLNKEKDKKPSTPQDQVLVNPVSSTNNTQGQSSDYFYFSYDNQGLYEGLASKSGVAQQPIYMAKRKLTKCGNSFTLKPSSFGVIHLFATNNQKLDFSILDHRKSRKLLQGQSITASGIFGLIETITKLQSMFVNNPMLNKRIPPTPSPISMPASSSNLSDAGTTQDILGIKESVITPQASFDSLTSDGLPPPNPSFNNIPSQASSTIPPSLPVSVSSQNIPPHLTNTEACEPSISLLGFIPVACDIILPRLRFSPTSILLGCVRKGIQQEFIVEIKNKSKLNILCEIGCIPPWLRLSTIKYQDLDGTGFSSANISGKLRLTDNANSPTHSDFNDGMIQRVESDPQMIFNSCSQSIPIDNDCYSESDSLEFIRDDNMIKFPTKAEQNYILTFLLDCPYINDENIDYHLKFKSLVSSHYSSKNLEGENSPLTWPSESMICVNTQSILIQYSIDQRPMLEFVSLGNKEVTQITKPTVIVSSDELKPQSNSSLGELNQTNFDSYHHIDCVLNDPFVVPPNLFFSKAVLSSTNNSPDKQLHRHFFIDTNNNVDESQDSIFRDPHSESCSPVSTPTDKDRDDQLQIRNNIVFDPPTPQYRPSYKFAVKNNTEKHIKLDVSFIIEPNIAKLVEVYCRFEQNESTSVNLQPDETAIIKLRVMPRMSGRIHPDLLESFISDENIKNMLISSLNGRERSPSNEKINLVSTRENKSTDSLTKYIMGPYQLGLVQFTHSSTPSKHNQHRLELSTVEIFSSIKFAQTFLVMNKSKCFSYLNNVLSSNSNAANLSQPAISVRTSQNLLNDQLLPVVPTPTKNISKQSNFFFAETNLGPSMPNQLLPANEEDALIEYQKLMLGIFRCQGTTFSLLPNVDQKITAIKVIQTQLQFYLVNPSDKLSSFHLSCDSIRYPGLKLIFENVWMDDISYWCDTLDLQFEPSMGEILPFSTKLITVKLIPGVSTEAQVFSGVIDETISKAYQEKLKNWVTSFQSTSSYSTPSKIKDLDFNNLGNENVDEVAKSPTSTDFKGQRYLLFDLQINIVDINWPLHPPTIVHILFDSDIQVPLISSQPISETNRKKQHLDLILTRPATEFDSNFPANLKDSIISQYTPTAASNLRIRGITPIENSLNLGFIDLGKHTIQSNALEWLLTLENTSVDRICTFEILTLSYPESVEEWLCLGQNGGMILPQESASVMLYVLRKFPGQFISFIYVKDHDNKEYVLRLTIEIVNEEKKKTTAVLSSQAATVSVSTSSSFAPPSLINSYPSSISSMSLAQTPTSNSSLTTPTTISSNLLLPERLSIVWFRNMFRYRVLPYPWFDQESTLAGFSNHENFFSIEFNYEDLNYSKTLIIFNQSLVNLPFTLSWNLEGLSLTQERSDERVMQSPSAKSSISNTLDSQAYQYYKVSISSSSIESLKTIIALNIPKSSDKQCHKISELVCKSHFFPDLTFSIPILLIISNSSNEM